MGFNPLKEKGMPIEKQWRPWTLLNTAPYAKEDVHPYSRARGILMNGIEVEAAIFSHQFFRHSNDFDLKQRLAMVRRIEQQQQKAVNWAIPANESHLEVTIGYEQVAVDLTAWLAQNEPDPYVKQTFDFGLLEDFDHLYRYANLLELTQGKKAEEIVGEYTEIMPGRPTIMEHRHPFDDVRRHYDRKAAQPVTPLHVLTLVAGEQQTMNLYMNMGNRQDDFVGRGLYLEIAQIEEQHVTQYGSLMDPRASWFEQLALHEYNECYLYYSFMQEETDPKMKKIWEIHLDMEIEHLRQAGLLMEEYENRSLDEILPEELPTLVKFQSNVDYVREVLTNQVDLSSVDGEYCSTGKMPSNARYFSYQKIMNDGGVPSQQVIEEHIETTGEDYRYEIAGPHPIKDYRDRKSADAQETVPKTTRKKEKPPFLVEQRHEAVFDLLRLDHNEVKAIFSKIKTREAMRQDLFSDLSESLRMHMELEEKLFYTALRAEEETRERALKAIEEHKVAKFILREIASLSVEDKTWMPKLAVLQEVVVHHIQEEESEMFDSAVKVLGDETIQGISREFIQEKTMLTGSI